MATTAADPVFVDTNVLVFANVASHPLQAYRHPAARSLRKRMKTLDQIRREGLDALRERLGPADMIRFLQQFETGHGDYARERHDWVDRTTLGDIRKAAGLPPARYCQKSCSVE